MYLNHSSKIIHQKSLIVICGPTAAGKTALAIDVAKHFQTEILSADSRQFYREMTIGTAKPTEQELAAVTHHFINNLSIQDTYTAGDYEKEALIVLDEIFKTHDVALMVGGSGLFIKAVCEGFDTFQKEDAADEAVIERIKAMPLADMQVEVAKLDPEYYDKVDKQNPRRLQRALEVIYATGRKYSEQRTGEKVERDFNIIKIGVELSREQLYERINHRVDEMMAAGQWQEAEALYPYRHLQPLQTVGYQEIFDAIDGKLTKAEAIEKIKQNTRRYAKRQMTWFKKDKEIMWFGNMGIIKMLEWGLRKNANGLINFLVSPEYRAHQWDTIEKHYIDLINKNWKLEKMLDLVRYIKACGLSDRLYGHTSLWMLGVHPDEYFGPNHEVLYISIEGPNMRIKASEGKDDMVFKCTFEYRAVSMETNFQIVCDVDDIQATFNHYIVKLGWQYS
jgi:tRNA dimethylallyltransferase